MAVRRTGAALLLLACGCASDPPAPAREDVAVRRELADELAAALAGTRTARSRAETIARIAFGEHALHQKMSCLEAAAMLARAAGTSVVRTPRHAVIQVDGAGGPLFLDPANPGAILSREDVARAHPSPANEAAARIYGRPLTTTEYQADLDANLAARELEAGRAAGALELAKAALAVEPDLPEALVNAAAALVALGRAAEAEPLLARAAAVLPDDAAILYNRGVAAAALGRRADALGFYEAALRLEPGHERARANRDALFSPPPRD